MADYAPNFTARYRLKYSVAGKSHKALIRLPDTPDYSVIQATGISVFNSLFTALNSLIWSDFSVIGAEGCMKDSSIFVPVSAPTYTGSVATTGRPSSAAALSVSFMGRTTGGLRWTMFLYGLNLNPQSVTPSQDFRVAASESTAIAAGIAALTARVADVCGNDGNQVVFYPYVNVKYNDYWVKRVRGG